MVGVIGRRSVTQEFRRWCGCKLVRCPVTLALAWAIVFWAIVLVVCDGGIAQERGSPGCLRADGVGCRRDNTGPAGLASAEAALYRRNLGNCLWGLSGCNRQLLAPDDLAKVTQADYDTNLSACLKGRANCVMDQVAPQHLDRVHAAQYRQKMLNCLADNEPCNISELNAGDPNKQEIFLFYKILAYIVKLNISFLFNHYPKFSSSALPLFLHYLLNSYSAPGSLLDVS